MNQSDAVIEMTEKAEFALCGAILKRGSIFAAAAEIVEKSSFRHEVLRWLWEAFENLHSQGLQIDLITATGELQRMGKLESFSHGMWSGSAFLSTLTDHAEPRHFQTYAEQVVDFSANRRLLEAMHKAAQQQYDGRRAKDIMADLNTELSKITIYSVVDEYTTHVATSLSEAYDWSTRAANGEVLGVKTGFTDLDYMLGSLMPGNMYVLAARPGRGKTAFLINIALHAASEGKKVAIFSLEMSRIQVAQRMIAQTAEVDLHKITTGNMTPEEWGRVNDAVELLERYTIHINDMSSINVNQIRSTSRKLKGKDGLDLILVDYIQLAQPDAKKHYSREQEVSSISRGLKWLARELDVPILAAAQMSRAIEQRGNSRPVLSDLRESGSLEQDAFGVMFIHQNEQEEMEDRKNVREIILEKNRNGATGSCETIWDAPHVRFLNAVTKVHVNVGAG